MARTKPTKSDDNAIVDYVAAIERTTLSYSINHHHPKWSAPRPYSRSLYLFGHWCFPAKFSGAACEFFVYGDAGLSETPEELPNKSVASVRQHDGALHVTAGAPWEFIATLSQAYNDARLNLVACRGTKLSRRAATLISICFTDRGSFESDWGEPLPSLSADRA